MNGENENGSSVMKVALSQLSPVMMECLEAGQEVALTVTGNSMSPFLHHQRDQVVLVKAEGSALRPGDVPLYRRRNGQFVLHRVVAVEHEGGICHLVDKTEPASPALSYTMLGDAQTELEPGITPDRILAVAAAFVIKGKRVSCDAPAYRRRVLRWHRLLFCRKVLVWLHWLPRRAYHKLTGRTLP